jgi:hypothetical protein
MPRSCFAPSPLVIDGTSATGSDSCLGLWNDSDNAALSTPAP